MDVVKNTNASPTHNYGTIPGESKKTRIEQEFM